MTLPRDIRFAIRMLLRKSFALTFISVITLAVGIGASTSIFSVVNAVLLIPTAFENPADLAMVYSANASKGITYGELSPADFADYRNANGPFEKMAAIRFTRLILTGQGEPQSLQCSRVSANFFDLLGTKMLLGRGLQPDEDQPGKSHVAVISYSLWQRTLGSTAGALGQSIVLTGDVYTVVGILPPAFRFPKSNEQAPDVDVWLPLTLSAAEASSRRNHTLIGIGRLRPSVTIKQAQSQLKTLASGIEASYPDSNSGWSINTVLLDDRIIGNGKTVLLVLVGFVGFILLIACANVTNLLLARGATRGREISLRVALGAGRADIVRQMLTESLVLALMGGAVGLLLVLIGVPTLARLGAEFIPGAGGAKTDLRVLAVTFTLALTSGVIFGIVPALGVSTSDLTEALKESSRSSTPGLRRDRIRAALVIVEVALSLVLLVGAGLMIKSFMRVMDVDPGFNPENILTFELALPPAKYPSDAKTIQFFESLFERISGMQGVKSVGAVTDLPMGGTNSSTPFIIEGRPLPGNGEVLPATNWRAVTSNYFQLMGIPLLKGSVFTEADREDKPVVVVIGDLMARRYWPGEDPVNKRIKLGGTAPDATEATIVGVVGNVKHWGLDAEERPQMYLSYLQNPSTSMSVVVRGNSDPKLLIGGVTNAVHEIDPDEPISKIRTMNEVLADSVSPRRFEMLLIVIFAVVALVLATIGLYGVISYSVAQRTREIGVRMGVGAQKKDILRLIIGQGFVLYTIGLALGVLVALLFARVMSSLLYGVGTADPATFIGVALLLAVVTLLATYFPARRALKVDPVIALRYE